MNTMLLEAKPVSIERSLQRFPGLFSSHLIVHDA